MNDFFRLVTPQLGLNEKKHLMKCTAASGGTRGLFASLCLLPGPPAFKPRVGTFSPKTLREPGCWRGRGGGGGGRDTVFNHWQHLAVLSDQD